MSASTAIEGRDKAYAICGAKKRQGPGVCTRPAGWGTHHAGYGTCKLHLGSTRDMATKAAKDRVLVEAKRVGGFPSDATSPEIVERSMQSADGFAAWLAEQVAKIDVADITSADAMAVIRLWQDTQKQAVTFADIWHRGGLEERRVAADERSGEWVADRFRILFAELGLDPSEPRVQEATRKALGA